VTAFMTSGFDHIMTLMGYLLPFLFVLALVVFVHEMGHFLVGRLCGVKVETFSLGFGPRLARFYDRRGTEWAISAIPLGGYVKFKGDLNAASMPDPAALEATPENERRDSFPHKSIPQRAAIVAAGPIANFVLTFVIFTLTFMISGRTQVEPVIGAINTQSAAEVAGFQPGDRVLAVNGAAVVSFADLGRKVMVSEGQTLSFRVERAGADIEIKAMPSVVTQKTILGTDRSVVMGFVSSSDPKHQFTRQFGLIEASAIAIEEMAFVIERTGNYIGGLFAGRERADQLSGPTRIAYISGKVAESGLGPLLILTGILSISIGLINLLPVPMLDGGHLVFYVIEALFGRPLSPRAQEISFRVGFAMVMGLMLFSTWNDIIHLTGLAF
jgi:regulator of sigma E protease